MELDVGLICDAAGCTFSTPDMGPGWYPAMVTHLQVHAATQHAIGMGGMIPTFAGTAVPVEPPGQRRSFSAVRSRPRSSKRDNNLAFPCPDCHKRSFATEAGLYAHRIQICGLRDKEKPTSLDYKCNSCPRAFTSPIGLALHMKGCQRGEPGSEGERVETRGDDAVAGKDERGEIENGGTFGSRGGSRAVEGRGGSRGDTREAAVQGRENQGAAEYSRELGSGGVQEDIGGGGRAFAVVQNPDYMANVTGANRGFGSSGRKSSGEITEDSSSKRANPPRCGEKRSNTEVSSSSKRSRSEVWVLAGRDQGTRDGEQETVDAIADFIESSEESGEVLENVSIGKTRELGRGVAYETPRSTTSGAASSSVRRKLDVSTPGSNQQRSRTLHQAPAGGNYQGSVGRSSRMENSQEQGGVTMQVEMRTGQGLEIKTYRVKLTTSMQKVIDKVALKLGKRGDQVVLTKDGRRVEPTAMAAIYTNAKLVASEV